MKPFKDKLGGPMADIFFLSIPKINNGPNDKKNQMIDEKSEENYWKSPSDYLQNIVMLKPPLTTKCKKATTHDGILNIGRGVMENHRKAFLSNMLKLLKDNDETWKFLIKNICHSSIEKQLLKYRKESNNKIKMIESCFEHFFENSLQCLENDIRKQTEQIIIATRSDVISQMNISQEKNLKAEKKALECKLEKYMNAELIETKKMFDTLLSKEKEHNHNLIREAKRQKNEYLYMFIKQFNCQNISSLMYVMCSERNKCRTEKLLLETQYKEHLEKLYNQLLDKNYTFKDILKSYFPPNIIESAWRNKILNILKEFLIIISYSLKLIPQQSTFLLDLEKILILQTNELLNENISNHSILIDDIQCPDENLWHLFNKVHSDGKSAKTPFVLCGTDESASQQAKIDTKNISIHEPSIKKPFVIYGDLSDPIEPIYGSRETLSDNVPLPTINLNDSILYAKCDNFESIVKGLAMIRCDCDVKPSLSKICTCSSKDSCFCSLKYDERLIPCTCKLKLRNMKFDETLCQCDLKHEKTNSQNIELFNKRIKLFCHCSSETLIEKKIDNSNIKFSIDENSEQSATDLECKNCEEDLNFRFLSSEYIDNIISFDCPGKHCESTNIGTVYDHIRLYEYDGTMDADDLIKSFKACPFDKWDLNLNEQCSEFDFHSLFPEFQLQKSEKSTQYTNPYCPCFNRKSEDNNIGSATSSKITSSPRSMIIDPAKQFTERRIGSIHNIINLHPSLMRLFTPESAYLPK